MGIATGCPRVKILLLATTPEEFENGCFNLKTHQIFFAHTTLEEYHRPFWICHMTSTIATPSAFSVRKAPFSKCFPSAGKQKGSIFIFLQFEELSTAF